MIISLLSPKLAAAGFAAAVAALGGGIAAAYTGSLPSGLQKFAHGTIAAPGIRTSHPVPAATGAGHPAGPSATGSAAYGLCNAYEHAQAHGNATQRAVAFRDLVKAAGGASKVAAYCAQVPHPGTATPPGQQAGSAHPSHPARPAHPAPHGKPTSSPGNGNGNGGSANSNGNGNRNGS